MVQTRIKNEYRIPIDCNLQQERMNEYKRLQTIGNLYGIESQLLTPTETTKLSPILNPKSFVGALYSPGDGGMDPSMYCSALIKGATSRGAEVMPYRGSRVNIIKNRCS